MSMPMCINQIFDFMVRDFARFALQIYGMHNTKDEQRAYCKDIMLIKAQGDDAAVQQGLGKICICLKRRIRDE
ncbi:MAG: hypothetical protein MZV70_65715 [Desulfobacterales bacterium]|nr:hypothetical protein [Desulfobacterales bacterium]